MNVSHPNSNRGIVFVAPGLAGECLRGARAVKQLEGVDLYGVCRQPPNSEDAEIFSDIVRIDDPHDAAQLTGAARGLGEEHGTLQRIVTVHESLLTSVAQAGEALNLPGMAVSTVRRVLDKSLLKRVLQQVGIEAARDQVIVGAQEARDFAAEVGFPLVLKPLGGSGGLATWRIHTNQQLETALDLLSPSPEKPVFVQEHLQGQELCIDTITIADEPRFHSVCCYRPTILDALEDPGIQWTCVMPRDISGHPYDEFVTQGLAATRALKVGNAMTHLEGFLLDGGGVRFTDATLRPAGARIGPMLAFAYDIDPYLAWARVAVDGAFDGPWQRTHAVGTIFLRGSGRGQVAGLEGLEVVRRKLGGMLVDSRLPRIGQAKSVTYTGDGYITVRHPETRCVEEALDLITQTLSVHYSDPPPRDAVAATRGEQWARRLRHFEQQLYKPAWDDDSLAGVGDA